MAVKVVFPDEEGPEMAMTKTRGERSLRLNEMSDRLSGVLNSEPGSPMLEAGLLFGTRGAPSIRLLMR